MGKRVLKETEMVTAPLRKESSILQECKTSSEVSPNGILTDRGDFIVRSKTIIDFDHFQSQGDKDSLEKSHFHKKLNRLATLYGKSPIHLKKNIPQRPQLLHFDLDQQKRYSKQRNLIEQTKPDPIIPSAVETRNTSEVYANDKVGALRPYSFTKFSLRVTQELNYLETAFGFINFFYSDAPTGDLKILSRQFQIEEEVLSNWLQNKDFILERVFKLKDSLVRGKK